MSNTFYPLGLIEDLKVERIDRTVIDTFEDGSSSANSIWGEKMFKRRFTVRHAPLSRAEFVMLQSFFTARSGRYDTFWFRDNVHRGGNAKVRLAAPLAERRGASGYYTGIEVVLEEAAPLRAAPAQDQFTDNGYGYPIAWYDANRQTLFRVGVDYYGSPVMPNLISFRNSSTAAQDLIEQSGSYGYVPIGGYLEQYQYLRGGVTWLKTAASQLYSDTSPFSIFLLARCGTSSTKQILFATGGIGAGQCLGIQLDAANYFKPWLGGTETWATARYLNSAAETWHSVAVTWASGGTTAKLYVNGALIGSEANARSYVAGPHSLLAAGDGSLPVADNNGVNHALCENAEWSLGQIQFMHNLVAYQYGMATVA